MARSEDAYRCFGTLCQCTNGNIIVLYRLQGFEQFLFWELTWWSNLVCMQNRRMRICMHSASLGRSYFFMAPFKVFVHRTLRLDYPYIGPEDQIPVQVGFCQWMKEQADKEQGQEIVLLGQQSAYTLEVN